MSALREQLIDARAFWSAYDWSREGEEWSDAFGGTARLYTTMIRPLLADYLPAASLLEIGTGYGRITGELLAELPPGGQYVGVDIVPEAVAHCRRRFLAWPTARFVCTEGDAFPSVPNASVDLAVSWDSLVHSGPDVLQACLYELARVLRPDGVAVLHHSNRRSLSSHPPSWHGRHRDVSGALVRRLSAEAGLTVLAQPVMDWGGVAHLDAITTVQRQAVSDPGAPLVVVSGLPRTGTSMMMQMLEAGGHPVLHDLARAADAHNARGYYEWSRVNELARPGPRPPETAGHAVKVLADLLPSVRVTPEDRVLYMRRVSYQIAESWQAMGGSALEITRTADLDARAWIDAAKTPVLVLDYFEVLQHPTLAASRVRDFLGVPLNVAAMAQVPDLALWHHRD